MSNVPFIKSIRPVNLLSFGPDTEEIELSPLNILIGPNGSGKSNLIEILGLLSGLSERDPWSQVIETGGAEEWIWKGETPPESWPLLSIKSAGQRFPQGLAAADLENWDTWTEKSILYSVGFKKNSEGNLEVATEEFRLEPREPHDPIRTHWFSRVSWNCAVHELLPDNNEARSNFSLDPQLSALSPNPVADFSVKIPQMRAFAEQLQGIALYRDWEFGVDASPRDPQPVGLDSQVLDEDMRNLGQVLKAWRDRGDQPTFKEFLQMVQQFYASAEDVDVELLGTHLRIMLKEKSLRTRTPANRLSDGTIRWLALTTILLNPNPTSLVCIEEPELGLHPDILPTLAGLLRRASKRMQVIVTTHSTALVDAFSDTPEAICVCEKVDGATKIKRLNADDLRVWLGEYSLGHLWASGQIGGNRW